MVSQCPARASSTELSSTSRKSWCRPRLPLSPTYMPGRFRTASKPFKDLDLRGVVVALDLAGNRVDMLELVVGFGRFVCHVCAALSAPKGT